MTKGRAMDIVAKMRQATETRFDRKRVRCPSLKAMAAFIEEELGYRVVVDSVLESTDQKIAGTRLRRVGRGRVGNRLRIYNGETLVKEHNAAETYRHNTEVAEWILERLEG
jgi:hypothetical protein